MNEYRITVCTPTFNRAYIIAKLFSSLKAQSFTNFEWLVVDDGSTDETEALFSSWLLEVLPFSIHFCKQDNGGKHRAVNRGLQLAKGEIFFVVDSDDQLTPDALEKIDSWFFELPRDRQLCGITANKGFSLYDTANHIFPHKYIDKTLLEMTSYRESGLLVLSGERAIAFYTEMHRHYLYPEFEGENFITEAVVYNRMARDGYKVRFFNDIIWIYEYQDDGLTKAGKKLFINNPRGYGLWLREKAEFTNVSWYQKLKMYYTFTCDLSAYYDADLISESIGAPRWLVRGILLCRTLLR